MTAFVLSGGTWASALSTLCYVLKTLEAIYKSNLLEYGTKSYTHIAANFNAVTVAVGTLDAPPCCTVCSKSLEHRTRAHAGIAHLSSNFAQDGRLQMFWQCRAMSPMKSSISRIGSRFSGTAMPSPPIPRIRWCLRKSLKIWLAGKSKPCIPK